MVPFEKIITHYPSNSVQRSINCGAAFKLMGLDKMTTTLMIFNQKDVLLNKRNPFHGKRVYCI
jgi:hypothetical protein